MDVSLLRPAGEARAINRTPHFIIEELRDAKRREDAAKGDRIALEEELIAALRAAEQIDARLEGSQTVHVDNFKVVVTAKLSRNAVKGGIAKIQALGLEELAPLKTKVELDEKGLKYLQDNEPETFKKVAAFIETKAAKTSVTVERKD